MNLIFLLFFWIPCIKALHQGSCLGLVCGRNANCHPGPVINNNQTTYWCRCHSGFGGEFCEQRCELQCDEGDKCVFTSSFEQKCVCKDCDNNGSLIPAQPDCPSGYGGANCQVPGWCYPQNCENGGLCVGLGPSARCICPIGYHGERCDKDVNECDGRNACGARATCKNTNGTYMCVCPRGFLPPDCIQRGDETSVQFKPKVCFLSAEFNGKSMYCKNGGICENSQCHCPPGYTGSTCEIEPRECGIECLHGDCLAIPGGFHCICHDGYSGSSCEIGQDNCISNKCAPGSKCINAENSYFCECPLRRTGQYCEKVDCTSIPGLCNHGKCINSPLSDKPFQCACDPGYEGELCDIDKNECTAEHMCLNNGSCVNLPGSFRCDCPRGFKGNYCDELVDMCQEFECQNGGICMHTSNRTPVCQCRNGFIGKRCEKECPDGFGGVRCELSLRQGVCSRHRAKCFNGGRCIGGFCTCPPDFTGNQCEVSRNDAAIMFSENTCQSDPCMNNATCIDVEAQIGYACICQSGFEGDICERRKDLCLENPCANGGQCQQNQDSFICMCPYGFSGNLCEREEKIICRPGKCHNGGICQADGAVAKCKCAYGFTGHECEEKINIEQFFDKEKLLRSICEKNRCWERANDGNCDAECNLAVCNFDGGDCSGKQEPFSRCKYGNLCADYFANGKCDQACNNEDCLYDGMDCLPAVIRCPVKIREHCAARFANGICDTECNTDGCGFDGGDCAVQKNTTILTNIRIKIQMEPREFQATGGQTLMEISSALRAAVRIQKDEEGPLVFEWLGDKETNRVEMDVVKLTEQHVLSKSLVRRVRNVGDKGVVVYLEVQEDCIPGKCLYTDSQSVVDIISARLAKQGTITFGAPISEAIVAAPRRPNGSPGSLWNQIIIVLGGFCAMGIASIGVLTLRDNRSRKRKMISAPVWMPPMEHEEKNRRHHQSINSSQHSLLDTNGYYDPKRNRGDYNPNGQYQQFYPVAYGNGYDFQVQKTSAPEAENLPENILLHLQAAGNEDITEPITKETVNLQDSKYNRSVLHWLAGNTNGKAEDRIVVEVEKCIKAGADVNALDSDENTPLMLAVKSRRVKLAVILMRAGADPTIYNKSERSALHEAAVNKDLMMMRRLLTDKRLLRDIDELDRNGLTVLMEVARSEGDYQVEMAKLLLSKGAKIDSDGASRKDSEIYRGRTALHYAALVDNLPMVEFLVSQNANKDKQDEAGQTPIMLAAKEGHERVVMMLIACGASVVAVDALDHSARQLAKFRNHHNIVDIFNHFQPQTLEGSPGELPVLQQHQPHQLTVLSSSSAPASRKNARQNCKSVTVKKQNSKKKETNSRDSTHLTPPPSDGSTSSPSPQHFMSMTHTTPTSVHYMSPEYQGDVGGSDAFQPQCGATLQTADMWYTTASPTYPPMQNEPMNRHVEAAYHYY